MNVGRPLPRMAVARIAGLVLVGFSGSAALEPALLPAKDRTTKRAGPDWWSFQPVKRPAVPRTRFDRLARNPIDRFIFARLEEKGLRPSPPVDRLALLRRATIDLTGLPPTPDEVDAFLSDPSPDVYEKVVDRLLASPAYGERWGRHWLDVVRFGESHGYEQNHLRLNAWPYRDYVIRSFNEDKPYPRFIEEQLAGDIVGRRNPDVEVATGFLVAGVHDTVGIQTLEGTLQQRANDLDDMVSTIGDAFLGLTVGCAKCHDHKFDPISQKDYYRLTAVVAGVHHGEKPIVPVVPSPSPSGEKSQAEAAQRLRLVSAQIADIDLQTRTTVLRSQGVNPVPRPAVDVRRNVEDFSPVMARFVRFTVLATRDGTEPCLDELEVFGPGGRGNLALASRGAKATASSLLPGYPIHQVHHLNDGRYGNEWSWISNERGVGWARIELPRAETVGRVVWSRDSSGDRPQFNDRLASRYRVEISLDGTTWRIVATGDDRAAAPEAIPPEKLRAALTPVQRERRARLEAEAARLAWETNPPAPPTAYVGQFTAPDPVFVLRRGDVMRRGEPVSAGALAQVPGLSPELNLDPRWGDAGRRLALAHWIADAGNPLTARVMVNRAWQHHFGRGIVGTPSDFGVNGEQPTHPELLDWLAADFMDHGWRLKRLHRMIVTSAAYRQGTAATLEGMATDAGNQLLWRMPLQRLEAEAVRDSVLAAAGTLDRRMGGPGFRLFKYRVVNVAIYDPLDEHGPETWRRGVYREAARAIREDLMASFDCPECAQRAPRREVTTTPLQALSLLNGPFILQQAGFFADRVSREAGDRPRAQVDRAFRLAFGRLPDDNERQAALDLVARRGLPSLCRALHNANEFLYY